MGYRSETIATTIGRLNTHYFLPAIQREFVWKPEQVIQLFDSILRGYPISSFLFWELTPENRDKWQAYKFIDRAVSGGTHNQLAITSGVQQLTLVLDGQQRLTSLLIGLKGTYVLRKKYKRRENPDSYSPQRLYLDLLKDSSQGEDGSIYFGLEFFEQLPRNSPGHYWFLVGNVLDFQSEAAFDKFRFQAEESLPPQTTKAQIQVFRRNLERLYRAIFRDEMISYYTEFEQEYDRVLDIFVRANEGGTKLSKSDLLLSMVTSKWDGMDAREEIYAFVDRLNAQLSRRNDFDKDFVMKACLVLTDLPVAYKVQNFNNANLDLIRKSWDRIKRAIESGVELINYFGIDRDNLTSANALIPVIYYLFHREEIDVRGSAIKDARITGAIRRWLTRALLTGVFGGSSDNMLRDIRVVLQKAVQNGGDFPVPEIDAVVRAAGRAVEIETSTLFEFSYPRQQTFLALSLLYDDAAWGTASYHQDHIFPRASFKARELEARGRGDLLEKRDRIGNLMLLWGRENQEKSDQPFEQWIRSRDEAFKQKHLIPRDAELWTMERFDDFIAARQELIKERLHSIVTL